ncbi:MAG: hypothetical protein NUV61_02135 [Candidatus Azambacteria bacterium]|nr:hypothetical protein [Candidatus Azambacteria bacterium]
MKNILGLFLTTLGTFVIKRGLKMLTPDLQQEFFKKLRASFGVNTKRTIITKEAAKKYADKMR